MDDYASTVEVIILFAVFAGFVFLVLPEGK